MKTHVQVFGDECLLNEGVYSGEFARNGCDNQAGETGLENDGALSRHDLFRAGGQERV